MAMEDLGKTRLLGSSSLRVGPGSLRDETAGGGEILIRGSKVVLRSVRQAIAKSGRSFPGKPNGKGSGDATVSR